MRRKRAPLVTIGTCRSPPWMTPTLPGPRALVAPSPATVGSLSDIAPARYRYAFPNACAHMPATPAIRFRQRAAPTATIDILFVIAPHSLLLDVAGPAEAFRLANLHREARGLPPRYRLRFAGPVPTVS